MQQNASAVGLEISIEKTVQIQLNDKSEVKTHLTIDGKPIAIVDEFKYLGSYIVSTEKDINNRIALAWVAFTKLKTILRSPKSHVKFKMRLFNASCLSVLLYGCESWALTIALEEKLNTFARKCYRIMLGINQAESHMTNKELYSTTKQHPISEIIKRRQHQFIGHCLRMETTEPAHIYVLYKSEISTNRRGKPRLSYRDYVYRQYEHLGLDKERLHEGLSDLAGVERGLWNSIVALNRPAQ